MLLGFVCYFYNADVQEDLLLCKTLTTFIPGDKIFKILDLFMNENGIPWKKYMDVCTDACNIANLFCRQDRNLNYSLCFSDVLK